MNFAAYVANVKERLGAQGFTELPVPGDLTGRFSLAFEREESWGRLIVTLVGKLNLTEPVEVEALVAAAGAWTRSRPQGSHMVLVFPFDRKVKEAESEAIVKLRQNGPEKRWAVIPWTADLEVELLDRHSGFPPVDADVARALAEVPRSKVEEMVRRSTGPRLARPRLLDSLSHVPATRIILAATFAYYIWVTLMGGMDSLGGGIGWLLAGPDTTTSLQWGANHGMLVLYEGQQWRLFTYMFLHGGILHLGMNMWGLWSLGQHAELIYGTRRMAFIYIVADVAGGVASTAFRGPLITSVGASGAIFGLFGALIYWGRTFRDRPINWHGLWGPVAINLLFGFVLPFVDNHGHIGGFIGGILAAFLAGAPGERSRWRTWAMGAMGLFITLLLTGLIPLPHFVPTP